MIDAELATAIDDRPHWRVEGDVAVYAPPDATAEVRVRPVRAPVRRERYAAAIVKGDAALYTTPWPTATSAVAWSERARLD